MIKIIKEAVIMAAIVPKVRTKTDKVANRLMYDNMIIEFGREKVLEMCKKYGGRCTFLKMLETRIRITDAYTAFGKNVAISVLLKEGFLSLSKLKGIRTRVLYNLIIDKK